MREREREHVDGEVVADQLEGAVMGIDDRLSYKLEINFIKDFMTQIWF